MSTLPEPMDAATKADWDLICSYMHYSGRNHNLLSHDERWEIYCIADGFGKMTSDQLKEINGSWDWSHIRDSSNQAVRNMAEQLRRLVEYR